MKISFIALLVSGLVNLISLILLIKHKSELRSGELIMIALLFSIAISAHGLFHAYAELFLDFNPLEGKNYPKEPITTFHQ